MPRSCLVSCLLLLSGAVSCNVSIGKPTLEKEAAEAANRVARDALDGVLEDPDSTQRSEGSGAPPAAAQQTVAQVVTAAPARIETWNSIRFEGGAGTGCADRIVIRNAPDQMVGTQAEYIWLGRRFEGYEQVRQSTTECDGKKTDIQEIRTADGRTVEVYFDVSEFKLR
jgi:hypothetical protein